MSSAAGIRCHALVPGAAAWECAHPARGGVAACAPDGSLIAAADTGTTFLLLRPADGSVIARVEHHLTGVIGDLSFSPDSRRLLVTETDNIARVWDLAHVREQLAALQLDWDAPAFPTAISAAPVRASSVDGKERGAAEAPGNPAPGGQ